MAVERAVTGGEIPAGEDTMTTALDSDDPPMRRDAGLRGSRGKREFQWPASQSAGQSCVRQAKATGPLGYRKALIAELDPAICRSTLGLTGTQKSAIRYLGSWR